MDVCLIYPDSEVDESAIILHGAVVGRPPIPTGAMSRWPEMPQPARIGAGCVIGANAVIYRGATIGENCLIGDTACIREGVVIGDNCLIAQGVTINYDARIGNNVKVMDNTHLTGGIVVGNDVFISTGVTTTNDNTMGRRRGDPVDPPTIHAGARIGQGACILPGVEIGADAVIGAGSVVTRDVPSRTRAWGVPARVING